jgi:hypothetical protein
MRKSTPAGKVRFHAGNSLSNESLFFGDFQIAFAAASSRLLLDHQFAPAHIECQRAAE